MRRKLPVKFPVLLVVFAAFDSCLGISCFEKIAEKSLHSSTVTHAGQMSQQPLQDRRKSVKVVNHELYGKSNVQGLYDRLSLPVGRFCFEEKCKCSGKVADCSHNYGRLKFIPHFTFSIRSLVFSFNNLTAITTDDFFQNVSWISRLDLSNNGLQWISPGAFVPMKSLSVLHLDNNYLGPCQLKLVFLSKHVQAIFLRNMNLASFPEDVFGGQLLYRLGRLDLSGNCIEHLNMTVFRHTPHLERLQISHNRLARITSHVMPHLGLLQIDNNALFELPRSCSEKGLPLFPRLQRITFSDNKFSSFSDDEAMCFTALRRLDMSRNPIKFLVKDMFSVQRFPQLRSLSLHGIQHIEQIDRFAFRSSALQTLSLMFNNIPFDAFYVDADCFAGNPDLQVLQLSHNFLDIAESKFTQLFSPLKKLEKLFMGDCFIGRVTDKMFAVFRNMSVLYLYGNRISDLPDNAFDCLTSLKSLILSKNKLQTVSETAFSVATRSRLKHLDLSGNPFACDCDLLWFQHWLVFSPSVFSKSYTAYVCSDLANTSVEAFSLTQQQCLWSHETYRAIIACGVVFIAVVIMVSVVYHYRWHIRLMLAFRGRSEVLRRRLEAENFDYDVFVSFAGEDLGWVQQHLMAKLETELGLRLCIHERDFVPGKNILNNIVDSVKGSKKYLMVFSRHFTHSPWCQFKLDLCLGHTLDYGDALIVTCLGDVASRDVTSTMAAVLETTTYIQWRDNRDAVTSFWDRVTLSLRDIMQGNNENSV